MSVRICVFAFVFVYSASIDTLVSVLGKLVVFRKPRSDKRKLLDVFGGHYCARNDIHTPRK
jgi:hypothetical protein